MKMPSPEELLVENSRLRAKLAELESAQLGTNLRLFAAQIPDNIMLLDREERIQFINWTVPGLTLEQVIGSRPYDYVPENVRERVRQCYREVLETGDPGRINSDYTAADGSVSRWEVRVVPWMRDGAVDGLIVISTNVTARDEAAMDRDRFFGLALDMLCVATFSGFFKRVSPAFTRTLGWSEKELLSRPVLEFVHPEDASRTQEVTEGLRTGGEIIDFENRFRCRDGTYRMLQWRAISQPVMGLFYGAARDVTVHKALEARHRQSQKMEAVGQLAGGIAHDFNNLLLSILMNAALAQRSVQDPEVRTFIEQVKEGARRAASLTQQLLTFSRGEPLITSRIDLCSVTDGMVEMLRRTLPENISIDVVREVDSLFVQANQGQIEQVLLNLCINARDALPHGGNIVVEIASATVDGSGDGGSSPAKEGHFLLLKVTDNGTGIEPQVRERIFEPFYTTKPAGKGTGLGLATVYGVVQRHHGFVEVQSEVGVGTTFNVFLPAKAPETSLQGRSNLARRPRVQETILVAETENRRPSGMVDVLEEAGYRVLVAQDGGEAAELVRNGRDEIRLAIVRLATSPDDLEVGRRIREVDPTLPVLFSSDRGAIGEAEDTLPAEVTIRQPYLTVDLLRRVRMLLGR